MSITTSNGVPYGLLPTRLRSCSFQLNGNYALGLSLLGIVILLWTASNFITQALFQSGFEKPFLVTYLNTSSFALYLLPALWRRWRGTTRDQVAEGSYRPLTTQSEHEEPLSSPTETISAPLTMHETKDLALAFCLLWFIANWTVNASLSYTSVASATILSSMSGLFTLVVGRLFMVEILNIRRIFAVILSLGGVILVSLSDSSSLQEQPILDRKGSHATHPVLGDSLALTSALFYAFYTILLKVRIRSESRIDMQLFFGFVGLYNILMCWVIGVILHLAGLETFELPNTGKAVGAILFNMFITFTSDYLYALSMLKTTPLAVTVGLSLTIPLAVLGDLLLKRSTHVQVLIGALLILISFVMVGLDDSSIGSKQVEQRDTLDVQ